MPALSSCFYCTANELKVRLKRANKYIKIQHYALKSKVCPDSELFMANQVKKNTNIQILL